MRAVLRCFDRERLGRPENAAIAGLPDAYILEQVAAYRDGIRSSMKPDYLPVSATRAVALAVSDADLADAADYFPALSRRS